MVKVVVQMYPVIRADGPEERKELRPIGRNRERYQEAMDGMPDIIRAMDDLGVWGISSIEHHFHSEGYEVGPNIGVNTGYWAGLSKKLNIGSLGYVMSVDDPIRVAEETAVLDHITKGRCFVGFARGYQSRWTNVLGQKIGSVATLSDKSEADVRNREIFEEQVDIVMKAWTEGTFDYKSDLWEYPYPHDTGVKDWFMGDVTRQLGAPGEMDDEGNLRKICVVPAPYTQPHPKVFIASNASLETVEYAGARGFIPTYFSSIGKCADFGPRYTEVANQNGHNFAPGQNQAIVRWPHIGETQAEGGQMAIDWSRDIFENFYGPLFPDWTARAQGADDAKMLDLMTETGLFQFGDVSSVRDTYVDQWKQLPAEYITLIYHYAQCPKDEMINQLKIFMEEVKPALDEIADFPEAEAAE
ncbi:MAG: LLM class flavin-dependent oxidoreductase [Alphaproteobacteria bacterium]|jgi:alkanesulfonate monooxygenase SsuD/methylene tetrahydromethanopterin reductase-like flavin-dependent oxidoreductase (luciferase family)